MFYVGVDPGKTGAMAVVSTGGSLVEVTKMPIIKPRGGKGKSQYDERAMRDWLANWYGFNEEHDVYAVVEAVAGVPPGKGHAMSIGAQYYGVGLVVGLLVGIGIRFHAARPQEWRKAMGVASKPDPKQGAKVMALRLWPEAPGLRTPTGKPDGDACDAALIAEHARRSYDGRYKPE